MGVSVLVMAEAPHAGEVKVRLEPLLGPAGCARLQGALIEAATAWAADVAPGSAYLAFRGEEDDLRPHVHDVIECFPQRRGDLGDRLSAATARVFGQRFEPLVVVGTDMPVLTRAHAREAEAVMRGGADVIFGPALDGGYWIVGLSRPAADLFELGGEWGGPAVLARTLERAELAGLRTELMGMERRLDDPADARALAGHPRLPPAVADALASP